MMLLSTNVECKSAQCKQLEDIWAQVDKKWEIVDGCTLEARNADEIVLERDECDDALKELDELIDKRDAQMSQLKCPEDCEVAGGSQDLGWITKEGCN